MIQYQSLEGDIMSKLQDLNDEVLEKVKFIDKDFELSNSIILLFTFVSAISLLLFSIVVSFLSLTISLS